MLKSLGIVLYSSLESLVLRCKYQRNYLLKYSFVHLLNKYALGAFCGSEILLGPRNTVGRETEHCSHRFTLSFGG